MHFSTVLTSGLVLQGGGIEALQLQSIPESNKLWGPSGRPTTLNSAYKRQPTEVPAVRQPEGEPSRTDDSHTVEPPHEISNAVSTPVVQPDEQCINGPETRQCWAQGFSIATDFDTKWPNTGVTKQYHLVITNTTCSPDGSVSKPCLLVNNQLPGPMIEADWGDFLEITVTNEMQYNGTSVHWHGIRQLNSNTEDGVNGITMCPIAPGQSATFKWRATQYGTSWYHSHFSAQLGDGVVGAIQINGPASANYDIDLGPYVISDWYYLGAGEIEDMSDAALQRGGPGAPADTIVINGTNKNPAGGGRYSQVSMEKGKTYRLRLVSTSVDNSIRVSLDGHNMTVIAADFVPVQPFDVSWILLGTGQRYDVIIKADQAPGNYWFRAEVAKDCASSNNYYGRAIFSYDGVEVTDPTTQNTPPQGPPCAEPSSLVPIWKTIVPSANFLSQAQDLDIDLHKSQVAGNGQSVVFWGINLTAIDISWEEPTLQYVMNKSEAYPQTYNLVELPVENIWTYWIVQETEGTVVPIPHPMHLHGHDFFILGSGTGVFNPDVDAAKLNFNNPPRRDVTFLPGRGWVVLAFPTDNPGAWLMHCHIAWHISQGLGVQFLEAKHMINMPGDAWHDTCSSWKSYYHDQPMYVKQDSGL